MKVFSPIEEPASTDKNQEIEEQIIWKINKTVKS